MVRYEEPHEKDDDVTSAMIYMFYNIHNGVTNSNVLIIKCIPMKIQLKETFKGVTDNLSSINQMHNQTVITAPTSFYKTDTN